LQVALGEPAGAPRRRSPLALDQEIHHAEEQ
jgi:hypothetical protein